MRQFSPTSLVPNLLELPSRPWVFADRVDMPSTWCILRFVESLVKSVRGGHADGSQPRTSQ